MAAYSGDSLFSAFSGGTVQEILESVSSESKEETESAMKNLKNLEGYKDDRSKMLSNQDIMKIRNMRDEVEEKRTMLAENPKNYIRKYVSLEQQRAISSGKIDEEKFLMRESEFLRIRSNTLGKTINTKLPIMPGGGLTNTEIKLAVDNFIRKNNLDPNLPPGGYSAGAVADFRSTLLQQDSNNNTHIAYSPSSISVSNPDHITSLLNQVGYVGGGR